jgi:hypothetical protein
MRCLGCGSEMRLEEVAEDETVAVSGFQRHTFKCSICGDVEQRLAFIRHVEPSHADAIPLHSASPVSPASAAENEDAAAPSVAKRVIAMLSRICRAVERRISHGRAVRSPVSDLGTSHTSAPPYEPVSVPNIPPTSPGVAELVSVPTKSPTLVLRETDSDLDECENLLRRAIEMVHAPAHSSEPSVPAIATSFLEAEPAAPTTASSLPEPGSAAPAIATSPSEAVAPAPAIASSLPEPGSAAPAIATSPSEAVAAAPAIASSLPQPGSAAPADLAGSIRAQRPPTSRGVVQIQYDPVKAKYVATDIKTGLRILRHYDSARLRAMCDRMEWEVVDGEVTSESYWSQVPRKGQSSRTNTVHRLHRERTSSNRQK